MLQFILKCILFGNVDPWITWTKTRVEVVTAVSTELTVFWDVKPAASMVKTKAKPSASSETLAPVYKTTRRHIREGKSLNTRTRPQTINTRPPVR
jgi:hypothetical protein